MKPARAIVTVLLIAAVPVLAAEIPQTERRSGFSFMGPDTQAMQNDDTANPGMLWVLDGEALWKSKAGAAGKACADCHDDAPTSMKGVAARYPAFDTALGHPVDLEQRINTCRTTHQQATPLAYESRELLALTAFLAQQSRRLRACISGIRAQPYAFGAPELVELELYLMWRARGMPVETPAVRP